MSSPARKRRRQEEGETNNLFALPPAQTDTTELSSQEWAAKWSESAVMALPERRLIISLDLDAFYVAASRKRDPSLVGLPIGIKQKGILATVSYEARALGVTKLATVASGLRQCPELVLVNGEDLSYFRRLSTRIWRLVCSLLPGCPVEKLGMDELFCDVTDLVDRHIREQSSNAATSMGDQTHKYFSLGKPGSGFQYKFSDIPGCVLPKSASATASTPADAILYHLRLIVGAHLAAALRHEILTVVGLTASAGIAHNKLLAKIVGNVHKPAQQTVFLPSRVAQSYSPASDDDVQSLLDPMPVRKLNGFGSVIVRKLLEKPPGKNSSVLTRASDATEDEPSLELTAADRVLLVYEARSEFSHEDFVARLASRRQGTRLWSLLFGIDDEPVVAAPEHPAQISIEDTYRNLVGKAVHEQLRLLSSNLLRRLEAELVSSVEEQIREPVFERRDEFVEVLKGQKTRIRMYQEVESAQTPAPDSRWKRYPLGLRLSVRHGWNNRISRQTKMPVGIFDLSQPRANRALLIANATTSLLRSLSVGDETESADGLNLINIAALDLSPQRPAQSIDAFLGAQSHVGQTQSEQYARSRGRPGETVSAKEMAANNETSLRQRLDDIDPEVLDQLPLDVRSEVLAERGLTLLEWNQHLDNRNRQLKSMSASTFSTDKKENAPATTSVDIHDHSSTSLPEVVCQRCGETTSLWLQHDHDVWPELGMPPRNM